MKDEKKTFLVDIATPNNNNLQETITTKIQKYAELSEKLRNNGNKKE